MTINVKVLFVGQHFWPEDFRINEVARLLINSGHEVDILTSTPNYPEGVSYSGYSAWKCHREIWNNINIYRVPIITRGKKGVGLRRIFNYISFVVFASVIGPWLLRKRKYDHIFVYAVSPILQVIPAIIMSWIKNASVVVWVQDLWPESLDAMGIVKNKKILNLISVVVRLIYKHCDLILVQSKGFILPVRALAPNKKIVYYPNSVDSFFSTNTHPKDPPQEVSLITDFTVLFAGNIGIGQAVQVIVDVAAELKNYTDIKFVILGHGSRLDWMIQQKKERNLNNLLLLGRFPVETMPAFMEKSSALLVTLADEPIFALTIPNKIQAYMAAGKPILACLNGEGAKLVTEAGAGIAVSAENVEGLKTAILKMYEMSLSEREKMGANAKSYYQKHFDNMKLNEELIEHFKSLEHI